MVFPFENEVKDMAQNMLAFLKDVMPLYTTSMVDF
jgi:hypothetical protein